MFFPLLAFAALATAAAPVAAPRPASVLKPMDLFGLAVATDPQMRPDGGAVAYVRVSNDLMTDRGRKSVWIVDLSTGAQAPLSDSAAAEAADPRWSPDGARLAYTAHPKGEAAGLYVAWPGSGRSARIALLPHDASHLTWSRDGTRIAFIMQAPSSPETLGEPLQAPKGADWAEPLQVTTRTVYRDDGKGDREAGYSHLFVVSADGGAPRQVTTGDVEDEGPLSWTPDARGIVFGGRRGANWERETYRSAIYRVSVADGALTKLTKLVGPAASAEVSPDGARIAFSGFDDARRRGYEDRRIYVMTAEGADVHMLAPALDRSLDHPHWASDGRSVYADYADRGVTKVARLGLDGSVTPVAEGLAGGGLDLPYSGGGFSVARDGTLAYPQGAPDHPADLAVTRGGRVTRLTHLNDDLLSHKTLGRVEALAVTSSVDKAPVDAWLVLPPGYDPAVKRPMILEIHGGPFASYGPTFATDDQLYAAAGYVVLYVNPRGSTSYGDTFADGIDRSYPGRDYDDLMSAVDAAVAHGGVDPERLYVTGGSGGGVLTAWIVGKTHRFRAAVSQKPVVNWSSEVLTTDIYPWMADYWFGETPWEDPQGYWRRSPLSLIGTVTTPTLVIVGSRDVRTPDGEAEQLYGALKLKGVPTGLVRVPGAFHDMAARPSHAAAKAQAVLAWFARYGGLALPPVEKAAE